MSKSTIILATLTICLGFLTTGLWWYIMATQSNRPAVQGTATVDVGLPLIPVADRAKFAARSALLYNWQTNTIVMEQNGFERLPIASITKLMTAMVAIDHGLDWEQSVTILPTEYGPGGNLLLFPDESVTIRDLFHASLGGSANNATRAYVRALGIPEEEFVQAMNRKAVELGLEQTQFSDVTGLNPNNISTAYEVARFAHIAFSQYPIIAEASSLPAYTFTVGGSGREHIIKNTNKLLAEEAHAFAGSKTGYLYEANYCLVAQGQAAAAPYIAVVLGSPSEPDHFATIAQLFASYQ